MDSFKGMKLDKEKLTEIKKQIREYLKEVKKALPQRVDPSFISLRAQEERDDMRYLNIVS